MNDTFIRDDYITEIYPSNTPPYNNNISTLSLSSCENVLRYEYGIPKEEPLIIVKFDIINTNLSINQVEYTVYSQDGRELNLKLCSNAVDINISYPIKDNIDLSIAEMMSKEGEDVFNISSRLYNDICYPYSYKNNDLVLKDRMKLFENYSICEDNCEYKGINYKTKRVSCKCNTKPFINTTINNKLKHLFETENMTLPFLNFKIIKCYKAFNYVFDNFNLGFWLSLVLILIMISLVVTLQKYNIDIVYSANKQIAISSIPLATNRRVVTLHFCHLG